MPLRLLPSIEKLVFDHLSSSSDVTTLATGGVGTVLYAGTGPTVWLSEVAGSERVRRHLAAMTVDVRCYGGTKAQADVLARTVHAVMHDMPGVFADGVVTDCRCIALPAWLPDEDFDPPRARYIATFEVVAHPALS
jgi:hypothetical protein